MQVGGRFIRSEVGGGGVLFLSALLAIFCANSVFSHYYFSCIHYTISIDLGFLHLNKPLILWVNEGLMTVFFFMIGLEIKYELMEGELNSLSKVSLPATAALGGMLCPAVIYCLFNWHDGQALRGWAIPTATDIAFSIALLSLLGKRIPHSLKIFLIVLAVFDDIGAILIIAVYYSASISLLLLFCSLLLISILFLMNRRGVTKLYLYLMVGFILWCCVLKSGVHATLSGVVLALAIPFHHKQGSHQNQVIRLKKVLAPWVSFFVLPIFAFANSGLRFSHLAWSHLMHPIPLGIFFGLFLGKPLGIWGGATTVMRCGLIKRPPYLTSIALYGVSLVAGIGFTMSLFIGDLSFEKEFLSLESMMKSGVFLGSLCSAVLGFCVLFFYYRKQRT